MSVTKRLRYEILRRDNHSCRYCGASAPDVRLTVDHVVPVALGGADDPTNLVTACVSCNSGKSSVAPDSPIVEDVRQDALRWAKAMQYAADIQAGNREARVDFILLFDEKWMPWDDGVCPYFPRDDDWEESIGRFFDLGLEEEVMTDAILTTMHKKGLGRAQRWKYFCGICWTILKDRAEMAETLIRDGVI